MRISSVEQAIAAIAVGHFAVVVDDESRENEGDLIIAAEKMTPEAMAFLVRYSSGVVCVALPGERLDELCLPLMVARNTESQQTAFTISVDYRHGTSTGISAADRSATVQGLAAAGAKADDFVRPGHVFPLRCNPGGVLRRKGHTEAASDLARLAGLYPAAALCEIVNEDGSMARRPDLSRFAARHGLPIVTVSSIISYRKRTEPFIRHTGQSRIPTRHGEFTAHAFHSSLDNVEHLALVMGEVRSDTSVLVRVHSECLTGDILGSQRCDCGTQLDLALRNIREEGRGVLVYLRGHEGRGIGLAHKLRAYELQDQGRDTVEANVELGLPVDARDYTAGANILKHFGIQRIRLMTNNPVKLQALASHDLQIVERVPLEIPPNRENHHYLMTKKKKLGHLLQPHNVMPSEIG